jgi:hypothetical protein
MRGPSVNDLMRGRFVPINIPADGDTKLVLGCYGDAEEPGQDSHIPGSRRQSSDHSIDILGQFHLAS